jgi:hypothetical protein
MLNTSRNLLIFTIIFLTIISFLFGLIFWYVKSGLIESSSKKISKSNLSLQLEKYPVYPFTDGKLFGIKNYKTNKIILEPKYKELSVYPIKSDKNLAIFVNKNNYSSYTNKGYASQNDMIETGVIDLDSSEYKLYLDTIYDGSNLIHTNFNSTVIINLEGKELYYTQDTFDSKLNENYYLFKDNNQTNVVNIKDNTKSIKVTDPVYKEGEFFRTYKKVTEKEYSLLNPKYIYTPNVDPTIDNTVTETTLYTKYGDMIGKAYNSFSSSGEYITFSDINNNQKLFKNTELIYENKNTNIEFLNNLILITEKTEIKSQDELSLLNDSNLQDKYKYDKVYYIPKIKVYNTQNNSFLTNSYSLFSNVGKDTKEKNLYFAQDFGNSNYTYVVDNDGQIYMDPNKEGITLDNTTPGPNNIISALKKDTNEKVIYSLNSKKILDVKYEYFAIENGYLKVSNYDRSTSNTLIVYYNLNLEKIDLPGFNITNLIDNQYAIGYYSPEAYKLYLLKEKKFMILPFEPVYINSISKNLFTLKNSYDQLKLINSDGKIILEKPSDYINIIPNSNVESSADSEFKFIKSGNKDNISILLVNGQMLYSDYQQTTDSDSLYTLITKNDNILIQDCRILIGVSDYNCIQK